ncbi:hypothetical protein PMAYCL1PPCAC_28579, partial [Pristionchus mayeri]
IISNERDNDYSLGYRSSFIVLTAEHTIVVVALPHMADDASRSLDREKEERHLEALEQHFVSTDGMSEMDDFAAVDPPYARISISLGALVSTREHPLALSMAVFGRGTRLITA